MPYPDIADQLSALASKYQYHKPPDALLRLQDLLRQCQQWLVEFLDSFSIKVPGVVDSRPLSITMSIMLYAAGAAALIILGYVLWRRVKQTTTAATGLKKGVTAIEKILDSAGLQAEAEQFARQHDFREACRSLYLSLLQKLHEREIAIFAPAKTNYEYSYLLQSHGFLQSGFRELAGIVELVWFGNKKADHEDYERCRKLLEKLEPEIQEIYNRKQAAREAALKDPL